MEKLKKGVLPRPSLPHLGAHDSNSKAPQIELCVRVSLVPA